MYLCNIDTNKALETGSNWIIRVLEMEGLTGAILLPTILVLLFLTVYISIKYTSKFINRKELQVKKQEVDNRKDELKQAKENQKNKDKYLEEIIVSYNENNKIFNMFCDKLQFSLNIDRIIGLSDSFIGIDRPFIQDLKAKLLFHVEHIEHAHGQSNFMYLYHEIDVIFKQKVIDKLKPYLFKNRVTFFKIEKECRLVLKNFLDMVYKKVKNGELEEVRLLLNDMNDGLVSLGSNLQKIIIDNYKADIANSSDIDYARIK